jgi:lactate dehydrogenase-like 2-hydroxyacid dehydrogenase
VFHASLDDMLPHSDFLSVHCASTPETRGLINERTLALLPEDAILVNTSRGDVVDDDALISALQSGKLAAAGLDVFPRRARHRSALPHPRQRLSAAASRLGDASDPQRHGHAGAGQPGGLLQRQNPGRPAHRLTRRCQLRSRL